MSMRRSRYSGEMSLREILSSSDEGLALLDAFEEVMTLDRQGAFPALRNRAGERFDVACRAVQRDRVLLERVRAFAGDAYRSDDLTLLGALLEAPVAELWRSPEELFADNRVALQVSDASLHVAIYLIEDIFSSPEKDAPGHPDGEAPTRYLSYFGGAPLDEHGAVERPAAPLILQLDFQDVSRLDDDEIVRLRRAVGLPRDGVLQVFADGMSDSRTAPELAGGGAAVRYLDETTVRRARPATSDVDVFEQVFIGFEPGPTYRASPSADLGAVERLAALEAATYRAVAMYYPTREALEQGETATLAIPRPRRVSHLLGMPSLAFSLDPQDRDLLNEKLPLREPDDTHMLLVAIAGTGTLTVAFGDEGWLQIWIRRSDLAACRFDEIVSFVRST